MKKYFLILLVTTLSVNCLAQKGRQNIGILITCKSLTETSWLEDVCGNGVFSLGLKYQYCISRRFSIEPYLNIYFPSFEIDHYQFNGGSGLGVNLQTNLFTFSRCTTYLTTGAGYILYSFRGDGDKYDSRDGDSMYARLGLGLDFRLNNRISTQFELGYDTKSLTFATIGAAYNF